MASLVMKALEVGPIHEVNAHTGSPSTEGHLVHPCVPKDLPSFGFARVKPSWTHSGIAAQPIGLAWAMPCVCTLGTGDHTHI